MVNQQKGTKIIICFSPCFVFSFFLSAAFDEEAAKSSQEALPNVHTAISAKID